MVKLHKDGKNFDVELPAFTYRGKVLDAYDENYHDDSEFDWQVGVFLTLPLTHVEFCREPPNESVMERIRNSGFETVVLPY